jgi:2-oxoglutarate ferredoxin oxidoreductase subunit beta
MTTGLRLKPRDYKSDVKPIWCPGCGHYSVLNALTKAMAALTLSRDESVLVSGIGCSSRLPAYTDTYGFHGVHGRGLAVAQGLKVARPDLTVIAMGGDGDGFSIGGNHFLHACRRNVDMTYIAMDNEVYGMTKGQASPTSPIDWDHSKLTPHGPGIRPFKPAALALAAGAPWIARAYSGNPNQMARLIAGAIEHRGFSFVHVLSQCITFCPEQTDWKAIVSERDGEPLTDSAEAARLFFSESGFETGLLFHQARQSWPPDRPRKQATLEDIAAGFRV